MSRKPLSQPCRCDTGQERALSPACVTILMGTNMPRDVDTFNSLFFTALESVYLITFGISPWHPSISSAILSQCVNSAWRHGPTLPYGFPREIHFVQPGRPQPDGASRLSKLMLVLEGTRHLEYLANERRNWEESSRQDWGYVWEFPRGAWQCSVLSGAATSNLVS